MTILCRAHPDFEGLDLGKLHDHIEKQHAGELVEGATNIKEYAARYAKLFNETFYDVGPVRPSDNAWVARTWGRPPKLGIEVADNERSNEP